VSRCQSEHKEAGFTLLETLVALAILGVVMSTVYGLIGSGLRSAHRDEDRLLLGLVAQNLLARSQLDLDPAGGTLSGDIGGGLRWRIESQPFQVPEDILPEAPRGLDEPLLPTPGRDGEEPATADLGTRAANASERESLASTDREATDREAADSSSAQDGPGDRASERQEPKEPLRLRLIRVVVEKGDQQFALSTLAMEAPRERPRQR
jgi:type II secretion system protein I